VSQVAVRSARDREGRGPGSLGGHETECKGDAKDAQEGGEDPVRPCGRRAFGDASADGHDVGVVEGPPRERGLPPPPVDGASPPAVVAVGDTIRATVLNAVRIVRLELGASPAR
jgi:hypothetical protein